MGDIPLYLSNVSVSIGQTVEVEQARSSEPGKDYESVELEAEQQQQQQQQQQREKVPRRIIHFSSGETMEEYSTDEEEEEEEQVAERKDLLSSPAEAVRSKLTWGPYVWFHMWRAATSTISACDYLGERMASFFGITSAKYQYAIDEYYRMKKERAEEKEENRLSEEAEQSCERSSTLEDEDEAIAAGGTPRVAATRLDRSHQVQSESLPPPCVITVPAIVTAT